MVESGDELKAQLKATWMAGDYGVVAKHLQSHARDFIARRRITPGLRVLDVACGTGNLTIPAAKLGAIATGVDIAGNLIEQARVRAQGEGVPVQFDEGDAEALPYPDASFDLVVSMYGAMFAPRPARAAAELVRVCKSAGQIAMANWTPRGFVGQMFKVIAAHMPPPAGVPSPVLWGDEATVRERLRHGIAELRSAPVKVTFKYPFSVSETIEFYRSYFGPVQRAFAALSPNDQHALRRDLEDLWAKHNRADDGTTDIEAEYLEVVATRA
jgi:ubiquinone/menaquinone biosynthesis C-methylase UbiE